MEVSELQLYRRYRFCDVVLASNLSLSSCKVKGKDAFKTAPVDEEDSGAGSELSVFAQILDNLVYGCVAIQGSQHSIGLHFKTAPDLSVFRFGKVRFFNSQRKQDCQNAH